MPSGGRGRIGDGFVEGASGAGLDPDGPVDVDDPAVAVAVVGAARGIPETAAEHPDTATSVASSTAPRIVARRRRIVIVTPAP